PCSPCGSRRRRRGCMPRPCHRTTSTAACATCAVSSIATGATSYSPSRPTTPVPRAWTRLAASRTLPRPVSISRGCCATASAISGRARVSARPVADTAARGGRAIALPNLPSPPRMRLVPVLVVVLFWSSPPARAVAGFLFFVACITDFFDGWVARRQGVTTALGQFLDPLADKLIVVSVLIMLAALPPEPR